MRLSRVSLTAVLLSFGVLLAGCADGMDNAMDKLTDFEFLNTKKKLPGERKPVFPEGVPGVTQGVPPEMMKGYQESETASASPTGTEAEGQAAAKPAAQAAAEKPKPKSKPKPKRVAAPKPQHQPQPQAVQAEPQPVSQPAPQATTAPWPSAPAQQPQIAWPAPGGQVSR
jgi:outer membrane biosynthesis protein TonB